jgi:hypothetical protein
MSVSIELIMIAVLIIGLSLGALMAYINIQYEKYIMKKNNIV